MCSTFHLCLKDLQILCSSFSAMDAYASYSRRNTWQMTIMSWLYECQIKSMEHGAGFDTLRPSKWFLVVPTKMLTAPAEWSTTWEYMVLTSKHSSVNWTRSIFRALLPATQRWDDCNLRACADFNKLVCGNVLLVEGQRHTTSYPLQLWEAVDHKLQQAPSRNSRRISGQCDLITRLANKFAGLCKEQNPNCNPFLSMPVPVQN